MTVVRFEDASPFARDLQARVEAYFAGGRRPRDLPRMYLKSAIVIGWWVGSWALLTFWVESALAAVLLAVSLGLSIAGIGMAVQHDANHGALSSSRAINRLFGLTFDAQGLSSFIWRHKHNVLHHSFTNIQGVDFDLDFGPAVRLSPEQRWRPVHRYQQWYLWWFYPLLLPKWALMDDFVVWFGRRLGPHRLPRPTPLDTLAFVLAKLFFLSWAVLIPSLFHPIGVVLVHAAIAVVTLGVTLSCMFQLAHCVDAAEFVPPSESGKLDVDFAEHQLRTTVGFAHDNRVLTWFAGGLNYQVEHHLFPRVCHLHYPALSRIVAEVARAHGIPYRNHGSLSSALRSHYRWLRALGVGPSVPSAVEGGSPRSIRATARQAS